MTALGAVIGRRIGISPQTKTDWVEIPNVWGAFIGRPGMLKSPAMGEALKPIHRLEAEAAKDTHGPRMVTRELVLDEIDHSTTDIVLVVVKFAVLHVNGHRAVGAVTDIPRGL
jgi:hypothetical protein